MQKVMQPCFWYVLIIFFNALCHEVDSLSHRQVKAKGISILLVPFVVLWHFGGRISVFLSVYVRIKAHYFRYATYHTLRVFRYPLTIVFLDHGGVTMTELTGYPLKWCCHM